MRGFNVRSGLASVRLIFNKRKVAGQVVETANWLEAGRYGRAVAGNLIGGTLLSEILYRMRSRIADVQPAAQRHAAADGFLLRTPLPPCPPPPSIAFCDSRSLLPLDSS